MPICHRCGSLTKEDVPLCEDCRARSASFSGRSRPGTHARSAAPSATPRPPPNPQDATLAGVPRPVRAAPPPDTETTDAELTIPAGALSELDESRIAAAVAVADRRVSKGSGAQAGASPLRRAQDGSRARNGSDDTSGSTVVGPPPAPAKRAGGDDESGSTAVGPAPLPPAAKAARDDESGSTVVGPAPVVPPPPRSEKPSAKEKPPVLSTIPTEAFDPLIGTVPLGQYRITACIGKGGFGAVYLADQVGVDRRAALKVVHRELHADPVFELRFHREAKVLAALDHHHIVRLYNFGTLPDERLFLAMEYGGDRTLADLVRQEGPLPSVRALRIFEQICEALCEAHAHGVIHRDMKPENVLLSVKNGEDWAKLVDVGIAKILEREPGDLMLTGTGQIIGTPPYFSPEQGRGLPVDARSDVYSAGIVLYEMLTGRLPIDASTPLDYVHAHAVQPPTPASKYGIKLPPEVDAILAKTLQKEPAKRFQSAEELRAAVHAARLKLQAQSTRAATKRPLPPAAIVGGAVALALGAMALAFALG